MPFKPVPNEMLDRKAQSDTPYTTPPAQKVSTQKVNSDMPIKVNLVVQDSEEFYCPEHQPATAREVKSLKGQVFCLESKVARLTKELEVVKSMAEADALLDGDALILELRKHFVSK